MSENDDKILQLRPKMVTQSSLPKNEREQKKLFLLFRKTPDFIHDISLRSASNSSCKKSGNIRFDLFNDAERILDVILDVFGTFDNYIAQTYGEELSVDVIREKVSKYLNDRRLADLVVISYVKNISCSAKLISIGCERRLNKPECRKYNLLINVRRDNIFLREHGIECLLDHEIGTHFVRAFNEGFQPWYWSRRKFHLSKVSSYEYKQVEEGLATIHTLLAAKEKYLGTSALLYYAICMSNFLPFGQLYDHLGKYIHNKDYRWKHCLRIKKILRNVNEMGGYAKDQCYFEGAYYLLANLKNIDFELLCRGKLTVCDIFRVKRVARNHIGQTPLFLRSVDVYISQLMSIAKTNGIRILPSDAKVTKPSSMSDMVARPSINRKKCPDFNDYLTMKSTSTDQVRNGKKGATILPKI